MVTHPSAPVPQTSHPFPRTPLRILRTETVLSRFPIHNLTTHGRVSIHLRRTNAQGDLDYLWEVSTSTHYGPPGPLAYKLDTLVINRLLDALPRPVPAVLKVGSWRQVAPQLALNTSGRQRSTPRAPPTRMPARRSPPSALPGPGRAPAASGIRAAVSC
jgi:hypothetical protein